MEELFDMGCETCASTATLIHRSSDHVRETMRAIYCPNCKDMIAFNPYTMGDTEDGWVIEYGMRPPGKGLDATDRNGHSDLGFADLELANRFPKPMIVSFILYRAPRYSMTPFISEMAAALN